MTLWQFCPVSIDPPRFLAKFWVAPSQEFSTVVHLCFQLWVIVLQRYLRRCYSYNVVKGKKVPEKSWYDFQFGLHGGNALYLNLSNAAVIHQSKECCRSVVRLTLVTLVIWFGIWRLRSTLKRVSWPRVFLVFVEQHLLWFWIAIKIIRNVKYLLKIVSKSCYLKSHKTNSCKISFKLCHRHLKIAANSCKKIF